MQAIHPLETWDVLRNYDDGSDAGAKPPADDHWAWSGSTSMPIFGHHDCGQAGGALSRGWQHAFETDNFIILPWDREIIQGGELVMRPDYAARL